jgi:hypothetical protein
MNMLPPSVIYIFLTAFYIRGFKLYAHTNSGMILRLHVAEVYDTIGSHEFIHDGVFLLGQYIVDIDL